MYRDRPGCLEGLLRLFLINTLFSWLQRTFGFGRGCSGFGCGIILLIIFACVIAQVVIEGIDVPQWFLGLAIPCITWWFAERTLTHISERKKEGT